MLLRFTLEERDYIVHNRETDLLLTEVGTKLFDDYKVEDNEISVEVSNKDYIDFIKHIEIEYIWKNRRIKSAVFFELLRRFIEDTDDLIPVD